MTDNKGKSADIGMEVYQHLLVASTAEEFAKESIIRYLPVYLSVQGKHDRKVGAALSESIVEVAQSHGFDIARESGVEVGSWKKCWLFRTRKALLREDFLEKVERFIKALAKVLATSVGTLRTIGELFPGLRDHLTFLATLHPHVVVLVGSIFLVGVVAKAIREYRDEESKRSLVHEPPSDASAALKETIKRKVAKMRSSVTVRSEATDEDIVSATLQEVMSSGIGDIDRIIRRELSGFELDENPLDRV